MKQVTLECLCVKYACYREIIQVRELMSGRSVDMGSAKTKVLREKNLLCFVDNKRGAPLGTCCSRFSTNSPNLTIAFCVGLGPVFTISVCIGVEQKKPNLPRLCPHAFYHGNRSEGIICPYQILLRPGVAIPTASSDTNQTLNLFLRLECIYTSMEPNCHNIPRSESYDIVAVKRVYPYFNVVLSLIRST